MPGEMCSLSQKPFLFIHTIHAFNYPAMYRLQFASRVSSPLIPLPPTHSTEFASSHFIIKIYGKKVKSLCSKSIESLVLHHLGVDYMNNLINLCSISRQMCGENMGVG